MNRFSSLGWPLSIVASLLVGLFVIPTAPENFPELLLALIGVGFIVFPTCLLIALKGKSKGNASRPGVTFGVVVGTLFAALVSVLGFIGENQAAAVIGFWTAVLGISFLVAILRSR